MKKKKENVSLLYIFMKYIQKRCISKSHYQLTATRYSAKVDILETLGKLI